MSRETDLAFLKGGGEVGRRLRALDWSSTPLGQPEFWPPSLKTLVRVMLDSRFAMWMSWGEPGIFFCNDAYLPTVGIKREWVLGARSDRVWEEIWHDIGPRIDHVLATGEATWDDSLQLFLRRRGYDEETFHTFSYSPVYDDSNQVAGMLCVVAEVTDRVIGERRLTLLRRLASVATASASTLAEAGALMLDAIATGNADVPFAALYLADSSGSIAKLSGSTRRPVTGCLPAVAAPGEACGRVAKAIAAGDEAWIEGMDQEVQLLGPWEDPVRTALAVPLKGSGNALPTGCLVLGTSNRRPLDEGYRSFLTLVADQVASKLADVQTRLEAQQRADALAELDRAKNLFFSNVSHELRTPLTLLLGPIDNLLARAGLDEGVREEFTLAQRNGLRLRKLVNSLLDFSRIEAGRVETHFQATDLASFTTELASVFRSAVEEAGLALEVRTERATQPAYVDRDMWERVVLNLLSNAFKFTFEGGIEVELVTEDDHARLSIRDTGVGIPADALPDVFDRFHRVPGARSRSQEGTGIGLALVKELVKLHGGTVGVTSDVGTGSTFTVSIPLGSAHLPGDRVDHDTGDLTRTVDRSVFVDEVLRGANSTFRRMGAGQTTGVHRPGPGAKQAHVHVVDDNADMRAYVHRLLEPRWRVTSSCDGVEALGAISRDPPDLVVTDVMMPTMDGRTLVQHIRANPATEGLPVIFLSAQAGDEARVAGLAQGADDYLVKPFSTPELLARVEVQLVRARLRQAHAITNKRLADIFRNAPVGVALLSGPDLVYEFVNSTYLGFVCGRNVLGLPIRGALPELLGQGVIDRLEKVFATGQPYSGHAVPVELLDPASNTLQRKFFEFVCQPLPEDEDHARGIAIVAIDVTELMAARLTAEEANRTKDEFIAVLGHELRNPLAPIASALELMKLRSPEFCIREREIIERQVKHLVQLVDDLLDVARIARGSLVLKPSSVELSVIVEGALETVAPAIEAKRQFLSVDVPTSGLVLMADASRLVQVVSNLLANASKFTPPGGRISLRACRQGSQVSLAVRDTGNGLTSAELRTVFGLFVQGRQELHRPDGGLGLGLAIALSLTRLHGGSISATSDGPGKGSEFTVTLALSGHPASPHADQDPAARHHTSAGRSILLVDDSADAAESLADVLRQYGHEVMVASDGPGALKLLAQGARVDVAVLDIGLPVMNGYELARHLRSADRAMRLIALSGYAQPRDRQLAKESGFDSHLVKPVEVEELLRIVEGSPA